MNDLISKIKDSGIKTREATGEKVITARPYYKENFGFFHLASDEWEMTLVKGVYKNNIREISGESPYEEKEINSIAQILADVERCLRAPATVTIEREDKDFFVNSAELVTPTYLRTDARNIDIPKPLTPVEVSLGKSSVINDKHLFSKSLFGENFPETLSPVMLSIAELVPEIFNPLFMSCNIKTLSPSMKILFGRPYINVNNIESVITAFYDKPDFFFRNCIPAIFKTIKKPSFKIPDDSALKISDEEIQSSINDIEEASGGIAQEDIFSDDFIELIALIVMTWEMIYIRLWKAFMEVSKILGKDMDETLKHIYMTRSDSILNRDIPQIMKSFDPASSVTSFKGLSIEHISPEAMLKSLPATRRLKTNKGKYLTAIKSAHEYLKMRDELHITTSNAVMKIRDVLIETGQKLKDESIFYEAEDIFFFEQKELNNIINDEFYGNVPFTLNFRKWQTSRFASLCLPYELYEKDVEKSEEIAHGQISKTMEEKSISCMSFFHKDVETEDFIVGRGIPLCDIKGETPDAIIAESATMFSFVTEFCAVKDIPLYTGARFANILLRNKKVSSTGVQLTVID